MNEERDLRIRIGFGALAAISFIATLHALTVAMALKSPQQDVHLVDLPPLLQPLGSNQTADYSPDAGLQNYTPGELPAVNLTAQQEKKNQIGPETKIGQIGPMPGVTMPSQNQNLLQADCPNCPTPAPPRPTPNPSGKGVKEYQLLVFIDRDQQSQELLRWFNTHPRFQFLRGPQSRVAVQIYSPGDTMYKTRYAAVVPASEFPAIVLADKYGGHIHAAGKHFIPRDPEKLYADLQLGAKLYAQAATQRPPDAKTSGAMTAARSYQWDDQVSPDLRLQSDPPEETNILNPEADSQSILERPGGLLDCGPDGCRPKDKSALIWADSREIVTAGLVVVIVIAVVTLIARLKR